MDSVVYGSSIWHLEAVCVPLAAELAADCRGPTLDADEIGRSVDHSPAMMSERSASRRLPRTLAMPRASTAADCGSKLLVLSLICIRKCQGINAGLQRPTASRVARWSSRHGSTSPSRWGAA